MRNLLLSTVALVALAGSSALAADLPSTKATPIYVAPAPAFTWTGFYIGADFGGGWANLNDTSGAANVSRTGSGVIGGGHVGYNYQINQFVLGLEGDFLGSGISGSKYFGLPLDATDKTNQDWLGSINGRLGVAYDRALFYAIGGTAFTEGTANVTAGSITGPIVAGFGLPTTVSLSHSFTGYDIGGGVEYAITNNWIGRAEYRYYDFGGWNHPTKAWVSAGRVNLRQHYHLRSGIPVRRAGRGPGRRQILKSIIDQPVLIRIKARPARPGFFAPCQTLFWQHPQKSA